MALPRWLSAALLRLPSSLVQPSSQQLSPRLTAPRCSCCTPVTTYPPQTRHGAASKLVLAATGAVTTVAGGGAQRCHVGVAGGCDPGYLSLRCINGCHSVSSRRRASRCSAVHTTVVDHPVNGACYSRGDQHIPVWLCCVRNCPIVLATGGSFHGFLSRRLRETHPMRPWISRHSTLAS